MILLFLSAGALAAPIVNGDLEDGFPSTVALGAQFGSTVYSACTGNIITPRIVLTAAHCSGDIDLELLVQFGRAYVASDVNSAEHELSFEQAIIHPQYVEFGANGLNSLPENDVALLVLAEDAPVEPTWFNFDELVLDEVDGEPLLAVGFGISDSASQQGGGRKRSVELTLDDLEGGFIISDSDTNPTDGNTCSGDSGGPVFHQEPDGRWVQWGVTSWGDSLCQFTGGYTRTDVMQNWLSQRVADVHGTSDLCEINSRYDDGVCDAYCEEVDPDCVEEVPDTGEEGGGKTCSSVNTGPTGWWAVLLVGLLRRRR